MWLAGTPSAVQPQQTGKLAAQATLVLQAKLHHCRVETGAPCLCIYNPAVVSLRLTQHPGMARICSTQALNATAHDALLGACLTTPKFRTGMARHATAAGACACASDECI